MRLAVHWLERTLLSLVDADDVDEIEDWLAGRDDELSKRRNRRTMDAVVLAGGEIG